MIVIIFGLLLVSTKGMKQDINTNFHNKIEENLQHLIQEIIMRKSLRQYDSVCFITDEIYIDLFDASEWFQRYGRFMSILMFNIDSSKSSIFSFISSPSSFSFSASSPSTSPTQNHTYIEEDEPEILFLLNKTKICHMYVILISDSQQAIEFLKFSDKYRIINTKSKYIILYDEKLFDENVFYIWRKIINVVFIRQYLNRGQPGNRRRGGSNKDMDKLNVWFELSTIPFPINFQHFFGPKRLDLWIRSKFRKEVTLFKDETNNLRNETLKVVAFAHIPGTVKIINGTNNLPQNGDNSRMFSGTEVEILETISKFMNFHYELYEPENADVELWGRQFSEENYTGLLGEMIEDRADFALGDLYYIPIIMNFMDLSVPYNSVCLTFLTPESLTDISWKTLILPFSPVMWGCIIICLFITSFLFYKLATIHRYFNRDSSKIIKQRKIFQNKQKLERNLLFQLVQSKKVDANLKYSLLMEQHKKRSRLEGPEGLQQFAEPINSLLYNYSMLLLVSLPKLPTGWSLRVLTGWYWIYCLLVVVVYRASMTAILSKPAPKITIDTLQELMSSKLSFGSWGEINKQFFLSSPDQTIQTIGRKMEIVNNSEDAVDRVAYGNLAFYENSFFLTESKVKRQTRFQMTHTKTKNETNSNAIKQVIKTDHNLHIMNDCVFNMPVSIGLQKNSPIKSRVDKLIRRFLEAGLVKKWLSDVMEKMLRGKFDGENVDKYENRGLMKLEKFYGAIVILILGYVLGSFVLLGELIYYRNLSVKQNCQ